MFVLQMAQNLIVREVIITNCVAGLFSRAGLFLLVETTAASTAGANNPAACVAFNINPIV